MMLWIFKFRRLQVHGLEIEPRSNGDSTKIQRRSNGDSLWPHALFFSTLKSQTGLQPDCNRRACNLNSAISLSHSPWPSIAPQSHMGADLCPESLARALAAVNLARKKNGSVRSNDCLWPSTLCDHPFYRFYSLVGWWRQSKNGGFY